MLGAKKVRGLLKKEYRRCSLTNRHGPDIPIRIRSRVLHSHRVLDCNSFRQRPSALLRLALF